MNRLSRWTIAGVLGAVALIVGGCATASAPIARPEAAPAYEAPSSGFASPENLLERYPTMRRQTL